MKTDLLDIAKTVLAGANRCGEHRTDINDDDIESCIAGYYKEGDYAESCGLALVRLTSGEWAVIEEWQDTSGHG